ncbi:MAG: mechanosensitive ion channel [Cyclobacteriaceae bacterium]
MEEVKTFLADLELTEIAWAIGKALLVFVIGLPVIRMITGAASRIMKKRNVDESLQPFLKSLLKNTLLVLLIITALSMLGVEMTSFVAIIGAAGLAVGLALQGTLQNFAGGVIILLLRPFKVGDYIVGAGEGGTVKEIQIFNTILNTPDNVRVTVPNGKLSNDNIKNYSAEATRRVDMVFGIGYSDDIKKAQNLLKEILTNDERVLKDPAPMVVVGELADSSVNFNVRPWVKGSDYWDVYFDIHQKVKEEFDANGISIPFPQRDVHLFQEGSE